MSFLSSLVVVAALIGADEPLGGDYGEPRLLVAAPSNARFAHLAWPKIVRTGDGTLVVGYCAGEAHTVGGSPAVSISSDGGRTFSKPRVLREFDAGGQYAHCGNLALGVARDGSVVLLAMAFTDKKCNTIVGWRSTDSGRTWKPVDTSRLAENKTGSVFGSLTNVPGKGLVAFGHYRAPSKPAAGIWVACSTDNGLTWGAPQLVTAKSYYEPAFTFTEGRFIGLLRHASKADRWRYDQAVSDDLGRTWQVGPSPIAVSPDARCILPSPFIAVSPADPSRLYVLQSERGILGESRGHIYLWTAEAKELNWQRQGLVVSMPKGALGLIDWSYPWMTPLDDKSWFLVFYAGNVEGANSIYGMTIRLPVGARVPPATARRGEN